MSSKDRRRILVVDDEEDVRILLAGILGDAGYEVAEAVNGQEAIRDLESRRPDLVVLDLVMPEIDGWGVLEHLRSTATAPPIVVLTGHGDYDSFARSVREGIASYVTKPFRPRELVETCARVLSDAGAPIYGGEERRSEGRRPLLVGVKVLSRGRAPTAVGRMVNLSQQGARVDVGSPLEPGDPVRVAFHVPGGGRPLSLEGEVRWRTGRADGFAFGLCFTEIDQEASRALSDLLRRPA